MTRSLYIALCAACILALASSAAVTTSLTSSAFAAAPGKVFDGNTGAADVTTWGTYSEATFGPGTSNTTVYAYGWLVASGSLSKVASRSLNATLLSNGTADTSLAAKIGDDAVASPAQAVSGLKSAVGLGSLGIAYAADVSGCNHVFISIYNGGSATATTKQVTAHTCGHCVQNTAGSGDGYTHSVQNIFYDNKTYWVSYTQTKYTETETVTTSSTTVCTSGTTYPSAVTANTKAQVFAYIQGVTAAGALAWTAPVAIYTGTASANNVAPSPTASGITPVSCGSSNWTNSTNFYCTYLSGATPNVINLVQVVAATGTAGSATGIATNVAASGAYPQTGTTYSVAGFARSQYQQGVFLTKTDRIEATSGGTVTYLNTLTFYNTTAGATATAGGVSTNLTNTYSSGTFGATGWSYGTGFAIATTYETASATRTWELIPYYANGSTNGTKLTFASGAGATVNSFIDANGALWAGAYSTEGTTGLLTSGYLGKLVNQVYSTYGNLLVTFFGLISFVLAALFVF